MVASRMRHLYKRLLLILSGMGLRVDRGDWLLPGRVLGCARPRKDSAFVALRAQGITVLINLHERPHEPARLARFGMTQVNVPLADFSAPTPEQLASAITAIDEATARGERVAVHCGGGLGRTGTILAAYLVHLGQTPDEAIAHVRELRPGSVETTEQRSAIFTFAASHRGAQTPTIR